MVDDKGFGVLFEFGEFFVEEECFFYFVRIGVCDYEEVCLLIMYDVIDYFVV